VNSPRGRNSLVMMVLLLIVVVLIVQFRAGAPQPQRLYFNEVAEAIEAGQVKRVVVDENDLEVVFNDGHSAFSRKEPVSTAIEQLTSLGVTAGQLGSSVIQWEIKKPSDWNTFLSFVTYLLPGLVVVGLIFLMLRQAQGSNNQALSFGKSRARMFTGDQPTVTFSDVAGVEEAKEELQEVVEFLKEPEKFIALGARIPKGVLLIGHPGTGKTLLAKAVSGEAGVPFFSISGSEFVEMFVGVGASRVRDLFEQAKRHSPCIVFVDEIDAVGRQRGAGLGGGHDEREQTLNQLLVEMDGFDSNEGIILIAATNRPDILDTALLRPGRFDRRIVVNMPDVKGREDILKVHVRKIPLAQDVILKVLARSTPGFSGADLANLVNEAALAAARKGQDSVAMKDMESAKDKVLMGVERKSMIISDEEKKNTAIHEAGHALVAALIPEADPIHKVTIIPRGMALGLTQQLPLDDRYTYTKDYLEAQLSVLMAGRVAENLLLNKMTTGAASDFEKSTEIARKMVCQWGMSELGPLTFGERDDLIFLGRDLAVNKNFSERTSERIDEEVKKIINRCFQRSRDLLEAKRDKLIRISELLLEKEVLSSEEIQEVVNGAKQGANGAETAGA